MGKLVQSLRHAFAVGPDPAVVGAGLPEPLERLARAVVDRGLEVPAMVLLESVRPLSFLGSQTLIAAWPLVRLAGNLEGYRQVADALEDREALGRLADRIEQLAGERDRPRS